MPSRLHAGREPLLMPRLTAQSLRRRHLSRPACKAHGPVGFPSLTAGTIPASWLNLPSLEYVFVRPGNMRLCGPTPKGMQFKVRAGPPCQGAQRARRRPAAAPRCGPPPGRCCGGELRA